MIRLRVGLRPPGSPASYLPERDFPRDTAHAVTLDAGDLVLRVRAESARLTFHDRAGRELIRLAADEIALEPRVRLRFEIVGEQHFYGLGEGGQQFDRLGTTRRLWNYQASRAQGADMAIPLLVSQAGYAIFFDNAAAASIEPGDIADGTCIEYHSEPGALDLYVIGGANLRAVMGGVADLLGHATCRHAGRSDICNRRATSRAPKRSSGLPRNCARSGCRATP
jgi:alpha-glucosidase (family GH31 glycosyl hydrolase)